MIGVPDERWGEVPKAVVVLKPGATLGDVADAKESAKESVIRAKARRDADPKTLELAERLDELTAYAKLCNVLMNNLDRDSQFLSRELTRRVGGVNTSARASRRA